MEDLKTYDAINKKNEELIEKKNQLEFILNRYHQVITKIEPGDDDEEKILINTVKEVFKKGNGKIHILKIFNSPDLKMNSKIYN